MTHNIRRTPSPAGLPDNLPDAHAEILRLRKYVEFQVEAKRTIHLDAVKKIAELKGEIESLKAEIQRTTEAA